MAITINGSGTITGISTGGLPDGIVDDGTLATSAVTSTKIADGTITNADINASAAIAGSKVDGSFGKVLQVVSTQNSNTVGTNSATWLDGGLSLSITPSSASSKILVLAAPQISTTSGAGEFGGIRLLRGTTVISNNERVDLYQNNNHHVWVMNVLDSPNTTSAVTYKTQIRAHSSVGPYIESSHHTNQHTLTLLEIGA